MSKLYVESVRRQQFHKIEFNSFNAFRKSNITLLLLLFDCRGLSESFVHHSQLGSLDNTSGSLITVVYERTAHPERNFFHCLMYNQTIQIKVLPALTVKSQNMDAPGDAEYVDIDGSDSNKQERFRD
jgi:hypothetical protein